VVAEARYAPTKARSTARKRAERGSRAVSPLALLLAVPGSLGGSARIQRRRVQSDVAAGEDADCSG